MLGSQLDLLFMVATQRQPKDNSRSRPCALDFKSGAIYEMPARLSYGVLIKRVC